MCFVEAGAHGQLNSIEPTGGTVPKQQPNGPIQSQFNTSSGMHSSDQFLPLSSAALVSTDS